MKSSTHTLIKRNYLPGDNKDTLTEMIRVNHSGELGAINIYKGQILATKHRSFIKDEAKLLEILNHMYQQEIVHFQYFTREVEQKKIRPSLLTSIWSSLGFTIGYMTGIFGEKTAMNLTIGVETVIGEHYQSQLESIEAMKLNNEELYRKISQFMAEELEHLDTSMASHKTMICSHLYLRKLVEVATNLAISIAKRI